MHTHITYIMHTHIIYIMHTHIIYITHTYNIYIVHTYHIHHTHIHTVIIMNKKKITPRIKGSSKLHFALMAGFKRPTLLLLEGENPQPLDVSTCAQCKIPEVLTCPAILDPSLPSFLFPHQGSVSIMLSNPASCFFYFSQLVPKLLCF